MKTLNVTSTIEHKQEGLPRFICIPMQKVDRLKLTGTTTVDLAINGVRVGRRSLKRWDGRNCWWMDLSNEAGRKANIETGDYVQLSLTMAAEELPAELSELIARNAEARQRWEQLTPGRQRMLREEITAAKQSNTLARRGRARCI
jgi:Bacteriocin-protection, YdeI or OmpD-Associated